MDGAVSKKASVGCIDPDRSVSKELSISAVLIKGGNGGSESEFMARVRGQGSWQTLRSETRRGLQEEKEEEEVVVVVREKASAECGVGVVPQARRSEASGFEGKAFSVHFSR